MIVTFKNDFDVAAASEEMSGGSTIILEGNVTNLTMPLDSTLVFRGGVVTGTLVGNNTTLVAPPVRIFGDAATVQGTFTNVCAYPVIKTPSGWMVQHLTASLAKLYELKTQIGEFTKGQSAFANDLLCPCGGMAKRG